MKTLQSLKLISTAIALVLATISQAQPTNPNTTTNLASAAMATLFVVHLTTGPAWDASRSPQEQSGMKEHSANLARMRSEGRLVAGALYKDSQADKGMIIVRAASREEVEVQFASDPMVAGRRFNLDIARFMPFYDGFIPRLTRADPVRPLAKFAWLAGCWEGRNGSTTFREHWMPEAGGMMMAMARATKESKVVNHEAIRLELDADGSTPVYVPTPSGQKEARFKLTSATDGKFVFENPQHDFPQRIVYQQNLDGSLLARIEGLRHKEPSATDFPMKRTSCE